MNLSDFNALVFLEYSNWQKEYSPMVVTRGFIKCNAVFEGEVIAIFNQKKNNNTWFIKKKDGTHRKGLTDTASVYITQEEFHNNIVKN